MQLSSNRGLLIRYFHHFGLSLHYINNSIRKFAAEIKTCGNLGIQALPASEQQNGQNNNKHRKLWQRNSFSSQPYNIKGQQYRQRTIW